MIAPLSSDNYVFEILLPIIIGRDLCGQVVNVVEFLPQA